MISIYEYGNGNGYYENKPLCPVTKTYGGATYFVDQTTTLGVTEAQAARLQEDYKRAGALTRKIKLANGKFAVYYHLVRN